MAPGYRSPRPLCIGIVQVAASLTRAQRAQARIDLALRANEEGYALLETFEVDLGPSRDDATYAGVERLAEQVDAQALVVSGAVDRARVEEMAERVRLMVVYLDQ
jgi:hypothetical protein